MALIHTTPKKSGTEGLLKILDAITDEIVLVHGKILMAQFSQNHCDALKLSLFIERRDGKALDWIGIRNVFIEDVHDTVELRFGDKYQTLAALEILGNTGNWNQAFPERQRAVYALDDLRKAALMIRDFMLFGRLPGSPLSPLLERSITQMVPEKGFIEFDVIPSLLDYDDIF